MARVKVKKTGQHWGPISGVERGMRYNIFVWFVASDRIAGA
jgi:hypothetical protein